MPTIDRPQLNTKRVRHYCVRCETEYPHKFMTFCPCGGMTEVDYDLNSAQLYESANPLERFFDLLPIEDPHFLVPMPMAYTPCIKAEKLGAELGLENLYLKNESVLQTGTTKDRMAAAAVSYMYEMGIRTFCASSTGNSSTAFAHAVHHCPEMKMFIFTAEDFADRVHYQDNGQIVHFVLRDASFVDAQNCSKDFAKRHTLTGEGGFFNPSRREGLKLAYLESVEQIPGVIDWYVQAISSAMGVYGTWKGARELKAMGRVNQLPRLLCVQQESCPPIARAFQEGCESIQPKHIVDRPHGIAMAILRGNPTQAYPYVRQMILDSNGTCVIASETEIREARHMVNELEGIDPCFSSSCAVAGLIQMVNDKRLNPQDRIMVNLTGSDRPDPKVPPAKRYVRRDANGHWQPDDPSDSKTVALWNNPSETLGQ